MSTQPWQNWAKRLVQITLLYNILEAIVALFAAYQAQSIALFGFGLDSIIESMAALAVLWQLQKNAAEQSQLEVKVHRFVGLTFLMLACYVLVQSVVSLWFHHIPGESWIGLILALFSSIVMPLVAIAKMKIADRLNNVALKAEAKESLACSILSVILLVGMGAYLWLGWWWLDSVAALLMIPWLVKEGIEGVKGRSCC